MYDTAAEVVEGSTFLLIVGALLLVLSVHLALACVRSAQRAQTTLRRRVASVMAALLLGGGVAVQALLAMAGEGLEFPVGYAPRWAAALALAGLAGGGLVSLTLLHGRSAWAPAMAAALLAALGLGVQWGWLEAAGFLPGLQWPTEGLALAAACALLGCSVGLWVAHSPLAQAGTRRRLWRWVAAGSVALGLLAGQQLVSQLAELPRQMGSVFAYELPDVVLAWVAGSVLALLLAGVALDLQMRRLDRRHQRGMRDLVPHKRRRRRYRRHRI